jgi:hypothetical protein
MSGEIVGTIITLALIGFIADVNSGAIIGSVFSVRSGWGPGFAFLGGSTGVRIVQGLFGLGIVYTVVDGFLGWFKLDTTTYILMSVAGLAIVLVGVRQVMGRGQAPAAAKPKNVDEAGTISVRAALTTGIAINVISLRQWIFTSLAISSIGTARVDWPFGLGLFALYLVLSSWLVVGLLVLKAVRPDAAPQIMDRIAAWADRNVPTFLAWAAVVVGVLIMGYGMYKWLG